MIGKFLAKIQDYGINTTKGNKPQVVIQFAFENDGQTKTFTWFGQLTPDNSGARKGIEITLKALAACGMTMENIGRIGSDFCEGPKTGILDMTKELAIELQEEPSQNDPGKMQTKVAWVNDPNDTYVLKKITAAEAVQVMGGLNFEGDFHKIVSDRLAKNPSGQTQGQGQGQNQNMNMNQNQGQNQNYNQGNNQNQNYNQNQGQGNGQGQNQNYNNGNQNQNYTNGQGQVQNSNQNQGQTNQGGNGFKAPF